MTSIVPAICTQCGSRIEVNPELDAAICQYCGTPFIVEKAIERYTIQAVNNMNISNAVIQMGPSADNLVKRAQQFEETNDFDKASEYYDKALDIDADNQIAREGLERARYEIESYRIFQEGLENEKNDKLLKAKDCYTRALNRSRTNKQFKAYAERIEELIEHKTTIEIESRAMYHIISPEKGVFHFDRNGIVFVYKDASLERFEIPAGSIRSVFVCEDKNYPGVNLRTVKNAIGIKAVISTRLFDQESVNGRLLGKR